MSFFNFMRNTAQQIPSPTTATTQSAPYTMVMNDDGTAEIVLYGDIVSRQPTDWDGNPIKGQFIILSNFLDDLKAVETARKILVRIHSAGGNAYDAITIHNRLKELTAEIEVIVDGVAMSGGSLIMCAADKVKVFPGSIVMIHCCWLFLFGGYNANELRRIASGNDTVDRSQAAIYHEKTGLPVEELLTMMGEDTYMTGADAVERGFADELVTKEKAQSQISASADRRTLFVNGSPIWAMPDGKQLPNSVQLPTVSTAPAVEIKTLPTQTGTIEGGQTQMPRTMAEIRAEFPEQIAALERDMLAAAEQNTASAVSVAVQAERDRIRGIDEVAVAIGDDELIRTAKYGDKPLTAAELALEALKKSAVAGKSFLGAMEDDDDESGTKKVPSDTPPPDDDDDSSPEAAKRAGAADAQRLSGGKQ